VLALMEMAVQGVSTRKVAAITEELPGVRFLVSDSQGASRQRCQAHSMRNLPGHSQDKLKAEAAIAARRALDRRAAGRAERGLAGTDIL
jgi:transposase-like protein